MRTVNDQTTQTANKPTPRVLMSLTLSQAELMETILTHGPETMAHSLKLIHDLLLYYSDVIIDQEEKAALMDLNVLVEGLRGD